TRPAAVIEHQHVLKLICQECSGTLMIQRVEQRRNRLVEQGHVVRREARLTRSFQRVLSRKGSERCRDSNHNVPALQRIELRIVLACNSYELFQQKCCDLDGSPSTWKL